MRAFRRNKRPRPGTVELNMTAMCDVVFQLLIYLILTAKPLMVLATLDVNRPSSSTVVEIPPPRIPMVEIMVFQDAFTVCGRRVDVGGLDKVLRQLSVADSNQTVIVKCAWDSGHEKLIEVLNICSEKNLSNVSVMSM